LPEQQPLTAEDFDRVVLPELQKALGGSERNALRSARLTTRLIATAAAAMVQRSTAGGAHAG